MNFEFFIAKRLNQSTDNQSVISSPIIRIAIIAITLSIVVMIVSVAIVTGFKKEIREKVIGIGAHIQILNFDSNKSYETVPIDKQQGYYPFISTMDNVKHMQVFATKGGIIRSDENIQGVICKGIDKDFDWSFFKEYLVEGDTIHIPEEKTTKNIVISQYLSDLLKLELDEKFNMYFVDNKNNVRGRPFVVKGIYETSLDDIDKYFVLCDIRHIQRINNWDENYISGYEITLEKFNLLDEMTQEIRDMVAYDFLEDGARLKVVSIREKYPQIFDWLGLLDMNVWIILGLMIFVACVNMASGLLIMILERTNMVGILKSLGAENLKIRNVFLNLSFFVIGKGLIWGNLIALVLCFLQMQFGIVQLDPASYYIDTVPINLKLLHLLLLNVGTIVVSLLIMLLPTIIITRIDPVKTIRFD